MNYFVELEKLNRFTFFQLKIYTIVLRSYSYFLRKKIAKRLIRDRFGMKKNIYAYHIYKGKMTEALSFTQGWLGGRDAA